MSKSFALAERITRTVTGPMWHGPALSEVLQGVTYDQATQRPIPHAHTIWELVLHITMWVDVPHERLGGVPRKDVSPEEDWPAPPPPSAEGWRAALDRLDARHRALAASTRALSDEELSAKVAGHDYTICEMLQGVVEHGTYHGGQIALLKKFVRQA